MKYGQRFNSLADASGFIINDTPFACTIQNGLNVYDTQDLHTNKDYTMIEVIDDVAYIVNIVKPLSFKSHGQTTISLTNNGGNAPDMKYSLDGGETWAQWDYSVISLNDGNIIYFKGNNPNGFSTSSSKYSKFVFSGTGTISASGNIMSLLDDGNCVLTSIPNNYCFYRLFAGCSSLASAPELPATTLANSCYSIMFYGCSSLASAPELPATTLASGCYYSMFQNCSNLTSAPELPATTLANQCYSSMFNGCTSLTSAPELPATTLASGCYYRMFYGCTNLNYIKCLATSGINTNNSTNNWVYNVKSTGTFIKDPSATWNTGVNEIPENWEVQNA